MTRGVRISLVGLACWLLSVGAAHAATCTISATGVAFGTYNVFATSPGDSTGSIRFRCTGPGNSSGNRISVTIGISRGASTTFTPRTMSGPVDALGYNVFRDAARTSIWGDGTAGTQVYANTNVPRNTNVTVTMYGRVPAQQDVRAGTYTDTLTVTIDF